MKNVKNYYKELGKVVYAIAMADGTVQAEEADKLHAFVAKEMALHEPTYDSSGMNQAFYVDFEFEANVENHTTLDGAVEHFKNYVRQHAEPGDEALITRSLKLMESVAFAYSKKQEKLILESVRQVTDHLQQLKNKS